MVFFLEQAVCRLSYFSEKSNIPHSYHSKDQRGIKGRMGIFLANFSRGRGIGLILLSRSNF